LRSRSSELWEAALLIYGIRSISGIHKNLIQLENTYE